jgi:type III secretion system low calcium response chaperone LcrH/SycD
MSREEIRNLIMQHAGSKIPPHQRAKLEEIVYELYEKGEKLPKDVFGFNSAQLESIYNYGYQAFQSGKYKDALNFFVFLRSMDPGDYRYWFGIAACHQHLKNYSRAIAHYYICTYLEPENPVPYFHMYDCYLSQNMLPQAYNALVELIDTARDQEEYSELKERAKLELRKVKKELKEQASNDEVLFSAELEGE